MSMFQTSNEFGIRMHSSGPAARGFERPVCPLVLLVEDEPLVRRLLESLLLKHGCNVISVRDGEEALSTRLGPAGPQILLSDINLPGSIKGPQLYARLRDRYPELRAIFTSGGEPAELARREAEQCRIAFLAKPFSTQELARKLEQLLPDVMYAR